MVVLLWYIYKVVLSRYSNYTKKMIIVPKFSLIYIINKNTLQRRKKNEVRGKESDFLSWI